MRDDLTAALDAAAERVAAPERRQFTQPSALPGLKQRLVRLTRLLQCAMYPGVFADQTAADSRKNAREYLRLAAREMERTLRQVLEEQRAGAVTRDFFKSLPELMEVLDTDIRAAYEGDPAAKSEREILLSYPAFEAVSIYRAAHRLHQLGVPLIPRMMTEYAHSITGIDIHPGASIGRYFFIDHGTGVVIGETCTIGDHVKLYQGVTLGARSFPLDGDGNPVKGVKRHPDIGNRVVIYAGATILGGETRVGDGCVIGGSVWLTHSLEPGQTLFNSGEERRRTRRVPTRIKA
jgi:serine O-acetyltransferase